MQNHLLTMLNYTIDKNKVLLNCTPIYKDTLNISDKDSLGLLNYIENDYKQIKEEPPTPLEKSGGLRNGASSYFRGDLFLSDNIYVKKIKERIYDEVAKYYEWIADLSYSSDDVSIGIQAFYQVMEKGDYHTYHNHSTMVNTTFISGCFYVDPGEANSGNGGQFRAILNPSVVQGGADHLVDFTPEKNKIIMFPAYMYHEVTPYFGDKKRIVIGFNVYKER